MAHLAHRFDGFMESRIEVWVVDIPIIYRQRILHDHITRKAFISMSYRQHLLRHSILFQSRAQSLDNRLNQWLKGRNLLLGEKSLKCATTKAVEFMGKRAESRIGVIKLIYELRILVPTTIVGVDLIVEIRVIDVKLIRANANDWAIFLVKLLELEEKLTTLDDVIICFIVTGNSCQFWTWDFGEWTKVQAVERFPYNKEDQDGKCRRERQNSVADDCHTTKPMDLEFSKLKTAETGQYNNRHTHPSRDEGHWRPLK